MSDATQIRINELARELEVKARAILEVLAQFGVTEKKTHSSSVDLDVAEQVRKHFQGLGAEEESVEAATAAAPGPEVAPEPVAPRPPATATPAAPSITRVETTPAAISSTARTVTPAPTTYPRVVPQPATPSTETGQPSAGGVLPPKPPAHTPLVARLGTAGAVPGALVRPAVPKPGAPVGEIPGRTPTRPAAAASAATRPLTPGPKPPLPTLPSRPPLGGMPAAEKRTPMPR